LLQRQRLNLNIDDPPLTRAILPGIRLPEHQA
jgi:hypothetical protein